MKVAITLDGLLTDTEALRLEWLRLQGDEKFLRDAAFWAALKPYSDVKEAIKALDGTELYVFAVRPKTLFLPTRAWLRNNCGIELQKDHLICPALKRYDARMLGIDAYIDSDPAAIENLKIETVHHISPYLCDRGAGASLVETVERVREGLRD